MVSPYRRRQKLKAAKLADSKMDSKKSRDLDFLGQNSELVFRNDEPRREAQYPNGWILFAHISPAAIFPQPYRIP
jgi:hypothetical protein